MTAEEAIRFLDREAAWCRSKDEHQAFCLLLPALMRVLELRPMHELEARDFVRELKTELANHQTKKLPRTSAAERTI